MTINTMLLWVGGWIAVATAPHQWILPIMGLHIMVQGFYWMVSDKLK